MNFTKKPIEFKTQDGVTLRGDFYTPKNAREPLPVVIMTHGFAATKEMAIPTFAKVFAENGLAVLAYDHRNLGYSDGPLRQDIDPFQQVWDMQDAISFVRTLPETDKEAIGIWGSSYSGGHVLMVGAIDRRVKCVVSQVGLTNGLDLVRRLVPAFNRPLQTAALIADRETQYSGAAPAFIPVVGFGDPNAVLADQESDQWFNSFPPEAKFVNSVSFRSIEKFIAYFPAAYVRQIAPTPLLMVTQTTDAITPHDLICEAYEQALGPKKLVTFEGGHFDIYKEDKNALKAAEVEKDWFIEHLLKKESKTKDAKVALFQ